jgi:hypothetical protein
MPSGGLLTPLKHANGDRYESRHDFSPMRMQRDLQDSSRSSSRLPRVLGSRTTFRSLPGAEPGHEIARYAMAPATIREKAMAAIQMNACSNRIQGCSFCLLIVPAPLQLLSSRPEHHGLSHLPQSFSPSQRTASHAVFFILSQRPRRPLNVIAPARRPLMAKGRSSHSGRPGTHTRSSRAHLRGVQSARPRPSWPCTAGTRSHGFSRGSPTRYARPPVFLYSQLATLRGVLASKKKRKTPPAIVLG